MDQLTILRKMSGEKRLEQAFNLSETVRELSLIDIKNKLGKNATPEKMIKELKKRLYAV